MLIGVWFGGKNTDIYFGLMCEGGWDKTINTYSIFICMILHIDYTGNFGVAKIGYDPREIRVVRF